MDFMDHQYFAFHSEDTPLGKEGNLNAYQGPANNKNLGVEEPKKLGLES